MLTRARTLLRSLRSFQFDVVQAAVSGFTFGIARRLGELVITDTAAERKAKAAWASWDAEEVEAEMEGWTQLVDTDRGPSIIPMDEGVVGPFLERRRASFVDEQVLPRFFSPLAQAWKEGNPIAKNLAMLPRVGDGGVHMDLAGPLMYRELPAVRFMVIALLGVEPELATAIGKRLLNEWHDLEPHAGLTDDELDLLRVERPKENSAP